MTFETYTPKTRNGKSLYLLPDIKELMLKEIDKKAEILLANAMKSKIPLWKALINPGGTMCKLPINFEIMDFEFGAGILPLPNGDMEIVLECFDTGDKLEVTVQRESEEQPFIETLSTSNIKDYFDKMLNSFLTHCFQILHLA